MWKKALITIVAFIGTISVVYALNQDFHASNSGTYSGGTATGTVEFKTGDRFYSNTLNPSTSEPMSWIIVKKSAYTNYANQSCQPDVDTDCDNPLVNGYLTLANESIGNINFLVESTDFYSGTGTLTKVKYADYSKSGLYKEMTKFNNGNLDAKILAPRDVTYSKELILKGSQADADIWNEINPMNKSIASVFNGNEEHGKKFFTLDAVPYDTLYTSDSEHKNLAFNESYHTATTYDDRVYNYYTSLIVQSSGQVIYKYYSAIDASADNKYAIRPAAYFDVDKFVFGVSTANGTGNITSIKGNEIPSEYTNLYQEAQAYDIMKLRYLDDSIPMNIVFNQIVNDLGNTITKASQGSSIYLDANANIGNYGNAVNTVSALIFDESDNFLYYVPLEAAKGSGEYELDTTSLPLGKYQIAIVNEAYNESSITPAPSSALSQKHSLEITDKTLSLTYTENYKTGVSTSVPNTYEYTKNVNVGDTVGLLAYKDGTSPYKLLLTADSNYPSNTNDYKNFEIATLNPNTSETTSSSVSPLSVNVKSGGPNVNSNTNSLNAGEYHFCILGTDANGEPNPPTSQSNICITMDVKKLASSVTFNTSTTTNVKIGNKPITEQITYTNPELAIGGSVPIYAITGGATGTGLNVTGSSSNLKDYNITIGSNSTAALPTTYTLTVTTPETDNYLSATATKQIMVYDDLTALTWTPSKSNYSPSDVTSGSVIGALEAVGGYGPYTYSLVPTTDSNYNSTDGVDNSKFSISSTAIPSGTQDVKTNTTLAVGQSYHIQMMVTDSLNNTYYQNAVITVIANPQAALNFKDQAGGTIITSFSLTYPDNTKKLVAEGGSGTGAITYDYAPTQPNGITPSDYVTVGTSSGLLTPKKPGTVIIRATKAGDSTYSSTYVDIPITILPAKQTLAWSGSGITQVSGSSDTWEMDTYWSGGSDTYVIQELLNGTTLSDDIGISTNVSSASASTPFTYSIIASSADKALVGLASNTLTISGKPSGVVQIKAERAGEQGYDDSDPIYLNLKINALPTINFTFDVANGCSANMAAASACTLNTKKLGDLSLNPATTGFTYSIKTAEYDASGTGNSYSTAPGIFTLANTTEVKLLNNLSNGSYRLTFTATDGNYTLSDLVVTITISNNAFNTASWTWKAGDVSSMSAVSGTMNVSTNENTDAYQRVYAPATNGIKDQFQVELKGIPSGASVTYNIRSTNTANVISHGANDIFMVDGAGGGNSSGNHTIFVEATVSMSGYSSVTVYLPIEITRYTQTIAFANNTAIFLPNNGVCTTIPSASVTSTHSNYASPGNPITYTPDSNSSSTITVNGNQICSVSGTTNTSAKVIATLDGDTNYREATVSKNVVLYAPGAITVSQSIQAITGGASNITYTPGTHIVAHDSASTKNGTASQNAKVANVKLTGMAGSAGYTLSTNTGSANDDAGFFTVNPTSGDINLNQDLIASDIFGHGNVFYIQVDVKDPHGFIQTVNVEIIIDDAIAEFYFHDGGNPLPTTGTGSDIYVDGVTGVAKYTETFAQNGTITRIETNRGDATYSVDNDPQTASDVIHLISGYTYGIDNATDEQGTYGGTGGKAYAKACIQAGSGYQAQCIYAEVEILKAKQTGFAFAQDPLNLTATTSSTVPLYKNHFDGQDVLISNSDNPSIVDAGNYTPGTDQELQIFSTGGPVEITATTAGNRNYESAIAKTHVNVTSRPATTLTVDVNPKPIYYGDITTNARINAGYQSTLPAYFTSSDSSIVEVNDTDLSDDESGNLIIKKTGTVDIEVCQTDQAGYKAGDPCPSGADYGYKTITVLPRAITLKLDDETIYTGQALPAYSFEATPVNGTFAGSDTITDFALPNNTNAMDGTSIISKSDRAGSYAIQGSYSSAENSTAFLSNYNVTIQDGTLTIKQDPSDSSWYYLEGAASKTKLKPNTWYSEDVYVKLDSAKSTASAGSYDEISNTPLFTNSDKSKFLISSEGQNNTDVYFRINPNGTSSYAGTVSSKQTTTVNIDKTAPKIKGAKGTPSTNNAIEKLINVISFNTFFKPGVNVIISTEDPQPSNVTKTIQVSGVKIVDYVVNEVDEKTGVVDATKQPITGSGAVDKNGDISFTIPAVGAYKVCAIAKDNAGNPSTEACYYVNVKHINVNVDDDDKPDFNDSDGDGCPDLNIKWKDPNDDSKWIVINGDRDYDGIPDLNIDSDGDGKADLNIDTDHDGKPDLNLVILTKADSQGTPSVWKPKKCVIKDISKGIMEEYCTGTDVKPVINVDTNHDGIPDINIDTKGDFKPHYNITRENETTPYLNIGKVHSSWKPDVDYSVNKFSYDSIGVHDPILNIDTDGDGLPDVNIDFNNDQEPDLNIDINGDGIPDIKIDSDGDGIADINLDPDADGKPTTNVMPITTWKPEKNDCTYEGVSFDTMVIERISNLEDQGTIIEAPDHQKFLPNYALKVKEYTKEAEASEKELFQNVIGEEANLKQLLELSLTDGTNTIQPNGNVKVKIPVDENIEIPRFVIEQKDGTLKEITVEVIDGFYVFETDYLGRVAIFEENKQEPAPDPNPATPDDPNTDVPNDDPNIDAPNTNVQEPVKPSVQGTYINEGKADTNVSHGTGGAKTSDDTSSILYAGIMMISMISLVYLRKKFKN